MGMIEEELQKGVLMTQTYNISAGGAYCQVSEYVAPLTKLEVTMLIPMRSRKGKKKTEVIRCEAIVVRTEPEKEEPGREEYQCALAFTKIESADRSKIENYVGQQESVGNIKDQANQGSAARG
jgi:c-di-GMP-binding flagellar brake protein YcgR